MIGTAPKPFDGIKLAIKDCTELVIVGCGGAVQTVHQLKKEYSLVKPVVAGLNSIGHMDTLIPDGLWMERCSSCGDCMLNGTGGICPITFCAKGLVNGRRADLSNDKLFIKVALPESYRAQQVHEEWFSKIEEVPEKAITVTIRGILKSKCIVVAVPEIRKAVSDGLSAGTSGQSARHPPCGSIRGRISFWMRRRHPCWIRRPSGDTRRSGSTVNHDERTLPIRPSITCGPPWVTTSEYKGSGRAEMDTVVEGGEEGL